MKKNIDYVLENLDYDIPTCHWAMYLRNFFGEEKAEEFFSYLIEARQIMKKDDIRTIINRISLSVYSFSNDEYMAFVGIYNPIDRENALIKKLENGFIKAQRLYKNKNVQLSKRIKKLGYSYTTVNGNWKDKSEKNTYQREKIFIIFSENKSFRKFKQDICKLVNNYNVRSILITDKRENDKPKTTISSHLFDTNTGKEIEKFSDTTIEVVEKYFTDLHDTKFLLKIPYENKQKILYLEETGINEYYTPMKQALVEKSKVDSFNMAMYKQALKHQFLNEDYNE